MSVKVSTRQVGDVAIADVAGKLTLGEASSMMREALRGLVSQGHKKILVNLSGVTYLDSSGIGELVAGYTTVSGAGGKLKLVNLGSKVQNPLQTTKLYTVFDVYDNETDGVKSFI
jgi:anti-sigma B factor antagonist